MVNAYTVGALRIGAEMGNVYVSLMANDDRRCGRRKGFRDVTWWVERVSCEQSTIDYRSSITKRDRAVQV